MYRIKTLGGALALTLATFSLSSAMVHARTAAASRARSTKAADAACFNNFGGGLHNNCSGASRQIEISLEYDSAGSKSISVTHTPGTTCYAFATNSTDTMSWSPSQVSTTATANGVWNVTELRGINTVPFGNLIAGCNVTSGGRVHTVSWNP